MKLIVTRPQILNSVTILVRLSREPISIGIHERNFRKFKPYIPTRRPAEKDSSLQYWSILPEEETKALKEIYTNQPLCEGFMHYEVLNFVLALYDRSLTLISDCNATTQMAQVLNISHINPGELLEILSEKNNL